MILQQLQRRSKKNVLFSLLLLLCAIATACKPFSAEYGHAQAQANMSAGVEQADQKWLRMGGEWNVKDGRAGERRGAPIIWNYHELMNYNSLVVLPNQDEALSESAFTEIDSTFSLSNPKSGVVEALIAFALQSPHMYYYYNFFAVKFSLAKDGVQSVSLVRSKRLDDTLPYTAKSNYAVETLFTAACSLELNKDIEIKIVKSSGAWHEIFREKCDTVTLYIDGKKIFSERLPVFDIRGNFAIGARGANMSIDYFTVKNKNDIIFTDDFSKNTIFAQTVSAVKQ